MEWSLYPTDTRGLSLSVFLKVAEVCSHATVSKCRGHGGWRRRTGWDLGVQAKPGGTVGSREKTQQGEHRVPTITWHILGCTSLFLGLWVFWDTRQVGCHMGPSSEQGSCGLAEHSSLSLCIVQALHASKVLPSVRGSPPIF